MLVLVVGPSGAGKDTLLNAARAALAGDQRFRFVQRAATRPAQPDGEQNEAVDETTFLARQEAGAYALSWRTNGVHFGIPADIALDLDAGRVVVANVSRAMVGQAASRFPVRVVEVTASPDRLARRMAARGRNDAVGAALRLSRPVRLPEGVEKEVLVNDGTIEQGARKLTAALTRHAAVRAATAGFTAAPAEAVPQ